MTNISLSQIASRSDTIPGVGCGNNAPPAFFMGALAFFSFIISFFVLDNTDFPLPDVGFVAGFLLLLLLRSVLLFIPIFLLVYPTIVIMAFFFNLLMATVMVPFWYLAAEGRMCTFGPSNAIAFSDLDQVFALAIGACAGLASIWDSISEYLGAWRGGAIPPDGAESLLENGEAADLELERMDRNMSHRHSW